MFTGLIESLGRVHGTEAIAGGVRLSIETDLASALHAGDSLATNGVCLTVVESTAPVIRLDVSPETLRVTSLGDARAGSFVNLERPVRADGLMGGHFVQGHVDTTGTMVSASADGDFWRVTVRYPLPLAPLLIPRGSVAVDGISLTVASLDASQFEVQVIPFTWAHTNLHQRCVGDRVNLEGDILGKYVVRLADLGYWARSPEPPCR